jgi:hypothetical protein
MGHPIILGEKSKAKRTMGVARLQPCSPEKPDEAAPVRIQTLERFGV